MIHPPLVPEKPRVATEPPLAAVLRISSPNLPAARRPTTWRDKRTADTIIYFANVLQNCRYSFSVQSIQFSAPRVRPDGRARGSVQSCDGFIVSRRHDHTQTSADNAISRRWFLTAEYNIRFTEKSKNPLNPQSYLLWIDNDSSLRSVKSLTNSTFRYWKEIDRMKQKELLRDL